MSENNPKKSVAQLAAEGDPAAIEYLKFVKLRKEQEALKARLSQMADVPDKFRDPEYLKAKEEYSGSFGDIARRGAAGMSLLGSAAKAAIKSPEDVDKSRVDQVVNTVKEVIGSPEKGFREQQILGEDLLKNTNLSEENKALLGAIIDVGADVGGGLGASKALKGVKALGKSNIVSKTGQKLMSPAKKLLEERKLKAFQKETGQLFDVEPKNLKPTNLQNAPEVSNISPANMQQTLEDFAKKQDIDQYKKMIDERALKDLAQKEKDLIGVIDEQKMIKELEETGKPMRQSEELLERMSKASEEMPTLDSRASEILAEKMSKASDDIPEIASSTILRPKESLTTNKIVKGLEKYGTSESSKTLKNKKNLVKQLIKKTK